MNRFLLKITEQIKALLPYFLRKSKNEAYLEAITTPIGEYNSDFVDYAEESLYRVAITGQVIYLERLLNDLFDEDLRRIYIVDFQLLATLYIYTKVENSPLFVYTRAEEGEIHYSYVQNELFESYRFAVNIPEVLYDAMSVDEFNLMRANIDLHKTAGTSYILRKY